MAQEDESMDRLERALERIARTVEAPDPVAAEVSARLDAVIGRLRAGLAEGAERPPGLAEGPAGLAERQAGLSAEPEE